DDFDVRRWDVTVGAGAFALSAGVGEVGYGYARSGGIVLSPADALPRVELQTTRPVRLPWVLGYLGDVSAHTFVSLMDEERHPTEPWLWGMRIAARPHERFTIALHRASIFGGEGRPATVGNLARMLVGIVKSDFENQVVSGEVRWRLPTDSLLPVTAYLEWGADDGAGAISEVPGRVAGLFLPALPGVPQVGIGGEYTRFGEACCGHGPWYFNGTFRGNWARGDQPLGHPLGGEGWEGAGYAQAELMGSRLRLDGRFFVRERSESSLAELGGGNLFSPTRTGRSTGGWVEAAFRLFSRGDVRAGWRVEDGDGWREQGVHVEAVVLF
ncbi:MAG TPA: capsule assembly Wzi family protein, partial [Longimicrobium sp.]|nr:capsule assembly Wzi family protein [Longimicrobium sp.]